MSRENGIAIFAAGIGIGIAVTLLVKDRKLRGRVTKALNNGSQLVSDALADPRATLERGGKAMSNVKDKVKDKIDDAADASKKLVDKVADKTKDAAHKAGEQLERGGKRLQDA